MASILFTASLLYQAQQLNEQRKQFSANFQHLKNSTHRETLLMAKAILEESEQKALQLSKGLSSNVAEIYSNFLNFSELKTILESNDAEEVRFAYEEWSKREFPALALVKGIKTAATIYLQSIQASAIDYNEEPEKFVYIYGPHFFKQPFFESYEGIATALSQSLFMLEPGRKSAIIAFFAAQIKSGISESIFNMDKLREDLENLKAKSYPIPKIAKSI